jgi:hypothetical protein
MKMLQKVKRLLIFVTFLFLMFSCTKDELTKPVKINFGIGFSDDPPIANYFTIDKGTFSIGKITFEGKRLEGGDYSFETRPTELLGVFYFSYLNQDTVVTHFDAPQGSYLYMKWGINLAAIAPDDDTTGVDTEQAGLIIKGLYKNLAGISIPFYFVMDKSEEFDIQAVDENGVSSINLSDSKEYNAKLHFNFGYSIASISRDSFENTEMEVEDNDSSIVISKDSNETIYDQILLRVKSSTKIVIQ